jgi:hypothetical protein
MMKILKILYYYYYSFYRKVDDEPHAMTVFALSCSQSFLVNFIIQMISVHYFCYFVSTWPMVGVGMLFIIVNYFLFSKSGFSRKIVKSRPPVLFSETVTKGFVIVFFVVTTSFLFWGPILVKSMLERCK